MNDKLILDVFAEMRAMRINIIKEMKQIGFDDIDGWYLTSKLDFNDGMGNPHLMSSIGIETTEHVNFHDIITIFYNATDDVMCLWWGFDVTIMQHSIKSLTRELLDRVVVLYPEISERSRLSYEWYRKEENYETYKYNVGVA